MKKSVINYKTKNEIHIKGVGAIVLRKVNGLIQMKTRMKKFTASDALAISEALRDLAKI